MRGREESSRTDGQDNFDNVGKVFNRLFVRNDGEKSGSSAVGK